MSRMCSELSLLIASSIARRSDILLASMPIPTSCDLQSWEGSRKELRRSLRSVLRLKGEAWTHMSAQNRSILGYH